MADMLGARTKRILPQRAQNLSLQSKMKYANVTWKESNRKISNFCSRKCSLSLILAVNCMMRTFTGIAVKLGLLLLYFFFKKKINHYVCFHKFSENFLPLRKHCVACGKMKHWLEKGGIPHCTDMMTVRLVPKVKYKNLLYDSMKKKVREWDEEANVARVVNL